MDLAAGGPVHVQIKQTGMETVEGTLLIDFSITASRVTAVTVTHALTIVFA